MKDFDQIKSIISRPISRRSLLKGGLGLGVFSTAGVSGAIAAATARPSIARGSQEEDYLAQMAEQMSHLSSGNVYTEGILDQLPVEAPPISWHAKSAADILTTFDYGKVTPLETGRSLREFTFAAQERFVEVARGVEYPAWTYNGTVPGPTIRCTEGDKLRIYFQNETGHPHSIHFHGIHPANMDGVFEQVPPGSSFVYDFEAEPFGLFLYHCHTMPVKKHIEKGLYGTLIVDPPSPRPPARELVMVMNGFDTDVDGENEFYTVNGVANYFADYPIEIRTGELVRIYLVNLTEFDLINSFHLHGNMFKLFRTGTNLTNYEVTDTVMLCQGERAVLEFSYKYPGKYMFHAHQSEFSELGWMGFFDVKA